MLCFVENGMTFQFVKRLQGAIYWLTRLWQLSLMSDVQPEATSATPMLVNWILGQKTKDEIYFY